MVVSPSLEEIHLLDRQDMQRRRHTRSTRGKDDYRNARMKRERDRMRSQMEREQEREVQKVRIAALFTSLFLNRFFGVSLPNRLVNTG